MRWGVRRGVPFAVALLVAGPTLAQEDLEARVRNAQHAARANAASAQGREWLKRHSAATGRLMIPVLNQCLPDSPGDELNVLSFYVRLSRQGRVREIVTDVDAKLGDCMSAAAREMPFPETPRDDYWVQVNLAAPL